jgi:hypothetical protein
MVMFDAYTDYPFELCGDKENKETPIRKVKILTYDRNKYCDILVYFTDCFGDYRGHLDNIKAGYLYKNEARFNEAQFFAIEELETLPQAGYKTMHWFLQ